jgi:hypothetical protein
MANKPHRAFKVGSVIWALVIGILVLFLGASIMLPSTKRARIDFNQLQAERDAEAAAATQAARQPTTEPSPSEPE